MTGLKNILWVGILAVCTSAAMAQSPCAGLGDFNADGFVNLDDYAMFADCLSGPGEGAPPAACAAMDFSTVDMDGDGDVDLADFAEFAPVFAAEYFVYGPHRDDLEAEQLAMHLSGEIRAPDKEYNRIQRDLALIRAAHAGLLTVIDAIDYAPDELLVGLNESLPIDGYLALNDYYILTDEIVRTFYRRLTFCDNINAYALAEVYAALPEVDWAEPNGLIGTADHITVSVVGDVYAYSIDDGFWDCFDGCDCHRYWELTVTADGVVELVSYQEAGASWCEF